MPQPIDLPTELARMDTTTRMQQIAERANLALQQRLLLESEEEGVQRETAVTDTPESESEDLDGEYKRRTPYAGRRRKRNQQGQGDGEKQQAPRARADGEGGQLDVSI